MSEVIDRDGRKVGVVAVELAELIELNPDTLASRFSERLVGHDRLVDLDYHVVGHVRDTIHLEVSGVEEPEQGDATDEVLRQIAASVLEIETLEVRGSDSLDFHEVNVAAVREALAAAYEAGRGSAERA
jgi:hypothetical protein